MDIDRILEEKEKMEMEMLKVVGKMADDFEQLTGLSLKSIDFCLTPVTTFGHKRATFVLMNVSTDLAL